MFPYLSHDSFAYISKINRYKEGFCWYQRRKRGKQIYKVRRECQEDIEHAFTIFAWQPNELVSNFYTSKEGKKGWQGENLRHRYSVRSPRTLRFLVVGHRDQPCHPQWPCWFVASWYRNLWVEKRKVSKGRSVSVFYFLFCFCIGTWTRKGLTKDFIHTNGNQLTSTPDQSILLNASDGLLQLLHVTIKLLVAMLWGF